MLYNSIFLWLIISANFVLKTLKDKLSLFIFIFFDPILRFKFIPIPNITLILKIYWNSNFITNFHYDPNYNLWDGTYEHIDLKQFFCLFPQPHYLKIIKINEITCRINLRILFHKLTYSLHKIALIHLFLKIFFWHIWQWYQYVHQNWNWNFLSH